ncbi:coiled-coil domain-containing protein 115-like [Bacillus rossius redtenbacheri]|uniref:coiled-coil domain-containing protein 115-like n=1 Tax=Bacillus rossius redtenbacheri TaxID=93214 RepID=UPI002FDE3F7D
MDAVCRQLDVLAVEVLELMQEQLRVKAQLSEAMKDGCLNLAKARYISGNTSISTLQLPCGEQDVSAQAKVSLQDGQLQLVRTVPADIGQLDGGAEEVERAVDPLQWFGVLVPRNLRQAQSSFRGALEWAVDAANVQLRLHRCQDQYQQLLKVKLELASAQ